MGGDSSLSYYNPVQNQMNSALSQLAPLAGQLASNAQGLLASGTTNLGTAANSLAGLESGQLPSGTTNALQQTLNNQIQNSLGQGIANLAASGTLGGNTLSGLTNQIGQNASNAMASTNLQALGQLASIASGQAGVGSTQSNLGMATTAPLQELYNTLAGQGSTVVTQGKTNPFSSLLGGVASAGGLNPLFGGLFGGGGLSAMAPSGGMAAAAIPG